MKKFSIFLISLLVCLFMIILSSCAGTSGTTQKPYFVADDETHTVGKISYITVRYVDSQGHPIQGAQVKIQWYNAQTQSWVDVEDIVSGNSVFTTDANGIATAAVLPVFAKTDTFRAFSVSDPSNVVQFNVTFVPPNWMVLIWMCGDNTPGENDLEPVTIYDLAGIGVSNNNVSIHVIYDGRKFDYSNISPNVPNITSDCYLILDENGSFQIVYEFPSDLNTGIGENIKLVLGGTSEDYPYFYFGSKVFRGILRYNAQHYALVLWNHGAAWIYDSRDQFHKGVVFDYTTNNVIRTPELREALEEALAISGKSKIDLLFMDACLMGSIEVAFELKNVVEYYVASAPAKVMLGGLTAFSRITSTTDEEELGRLIVDDYIQTVQEILEQNNWQWEYVPFLGMTAWWLPAMDSFIYSFNNLALGLVDALDADPSLGYRILNYYRFPVDNDGYSFLVDFGYFLTCLEDEPLVSDLAYEVEWDLLNMLIYGKVIYRESPSDVYSFVVPSILLPSGDYISDEQVDDYNSLRFVSYTYWGYFINTLFWGVPSNGPILKASQ